MSLFRVLHSLFPRQPSVGVLCQISCFIAKRSSCWAPFSRHIGSPDKRTRMSVKISGRFVFQKTTKFKNAAATTASRFIVAFMCMGERSQAFLSKLHSVHVSEVLTRMEVFLRNDTSLLFDFLRLSAPQSFVQYPLILPCLLFA